MNAQHGRVLSIAYNVSRRLLCSPLSAKRLLYRLFLRLVSCLVFSYFWFGSSQRGTLSCLTTTRNDRNVRKFGRPARTERTTTSLAGLPLPVSSRFLLLSSFLSFWLALSFLRFLSWNFIEAGSPSHTFSSRAIPSFPSFVRVENERPETEREGEREERKYEATSPFRTFVPWSLHPGSLLETHVSSFLWKRNE